MSASEQTAGATQALAVDWLAECKQLAAELTEIFAAYPTFDDRAVTVGTGAGGDQTLVIDKAAEDAVFAVLDRLHAGGAEFTAVSEERGLVEFGGGPVRVVIDPIDGSLNAKRAGLSYSLSFAVASGPSMADVQFGYVYDFGSSEHWHAELGAGAFLDGRRLNTGAAGNGLEVVGLESTKPANLTPELLAHLSGRVNRLRSIGSIALTLCQVAATRFDGMCSLRPCRSIDAAAGQLIVRETGAHVTFADRRDDLGAILDLESRPLIAAARTEDGLDFLLDGLAGRGAA